MKKSLFALSVLSAAVISGCSGGGSESTPNVSQLLNEKVAQNPQSANNYASFLASASAKVISVISGIRSSDDIPDFIKKPSFVIGNLEIIKETLGQANGTYDCDNDGTYTITTGQSNKTVTFNNCEVFNVKINGKLDYSMIDNNNNNIPEKINATFYKDSTIEITDDISIMQNPPSSSNSTAKIINNNITFSIDGKLANGEIFELDQNNKIKKVNADFTLNNANIQLTLSNGNIYTITDEQITSSIYKDGVSVKTDTDIKNLVITDTKGNKIEQNFGIKILAELNPQTNQLKNVSLTLKKGKFLSITYNNSLNTIELENDLNINIMGKMDNGDITKPVPTTTDNNGLTPLDVKADIVINGGYIDTNIMGSINNIKFEDITISVNTIDSGIVDREFSINGKIYVDETLLLRDKYVITYSTEKPFKLTKSENCPHEGKLNIGDNISVTAHTDIVNKLKGMFNDTVLFDKPCNQIKIINPIYPQNNT